MGPPLGSSEGAKFNLTTMANRRKRVPSLRKWTGWAKFARRIVELIGVVLDLFV